MAHMALFTAAALIAIVFGFPHTFSLCASTGRIVFGFGILNSATQITLFLLA